MKKTQFIFSVIISVVFLTGCSNKEYEETMENGTEAIEVKEYEEAIIFFEQALEVKSNDKKAKNHLNQTKSFLEGIKLFNKGNFTEATKTFNNVLQFEQGSATLQKEAEKQLAEIENIKITYNNLENSLKKAKEFDDNKEYKKALSLIDKTLENDFNHDSLDLLKQDLIELQTDLKTAGKEINEQDNKQAFINQVMGYWSYAENEYELCHFTEEHFVCAIIASEFYFYGRINSWDVNLADKTVVITHSNNNYSLRASLPNSNTLLFGEDEYNRISVEEVKNKLSSFDIENINNFFDIKKYEMWDYENKT